jgi:photosystem II stability/assembly factor-like uncharacterized protein
MRVAILVVLLISNSLGEIWIPQESHTKESLRGLSVVSKRVVWASGTHGTYLRTTDSGKTWVPAQVPGAESLDFRDVEAFSADLAYLLAAGPGEQSRIYKTSDGGNHWDLQFTNHEPKGFFDCMAFWDTQRGIVVGDPVNRRFQLLTTDDGGQHWNHVSADNLPPAEDGEGAFAASGSCITTQGKSNVWFVTGGSAARVFRSTDAGKTWSVTDTPIMHGPASAGIFSIAFRDAKHGVIAGGDYKEPEKGGPNLAISNNGGKTWKLVRISQQKYFSAIAHVRGHPGSILAGGSSALALSQNNLRSWKLFSTAKVNAVGSDNDLVLWAVGADGMIFKTAFPLVITVD